MGSCNRFWKPTFGPNKQKRPNTNEPQFPWPLAPETVAQIEKALDRLGRPHLFETPSLVQQSAS